MELQLLINCLSRFLLSFGLSTVWCIHTKTDERRGHLEQTNKPLTQESCHKLKPPLLKFGDESKQIHKNRWKTQERKKHFFFFFKACPIFQHSVSSLHENSAKNIWAQNWTVCFSFERNNPVYACAAEVGREKEPTSALFCLALFQLYKDDSLKEYRRKKYKNRKGGLQE